MVNCTKLMQFEENLKVKSNILMLCFIMDPVPIPCCPWVCTPGRGGLQWYSRLPTR